MLIINTMLFLLHNRLRTDTINELTMPRCFMAKKLKYPYEQWKQEQQQKDSSRSPSPADLDHLERSNQLSASAASSESEQMTHSKSDLNHSNPFLNKTIPSVVFWASHLIIFCSLGLSHSYICALESNF